MRRSDANAGPGGGNEPIGLTKNRKFWSRTTPSTLRKTRDCPSLTSGQAMLRVSLSTISMVTTRPEWSVLTDRLC